jgi:hypothetical protein
VALPSPSTAWKFGRWAIRGAEYAVPAGLAYLSDQLTAGDEPVANPVWMKWVVVFTRSSPAGTSEDRGQVGFHLTNITGGAVDGTWTGADFATVKAAFDTWVAAVKVVVPTTHTFAEYRAYRMAFDPADPGPGLRKGSGLSAFAESGPPKYVATISVAGTAGEVPYQQAMSVTLRTAWPRHWGRIYLPGGGGVSVGRFSATNRNTVANATHALQGTLSDSEFHLSVPVTQLNKATHHRLLGVTEQVVDDIPDVIRRRRPKQVAARSVGA